MDKNITKAEVEALISYSKFYFNTGKSSKDKKVIPVEFENEPMEGFVLNKKAGGTKYGWNARQTYCRVYDPRGFEFEISIPNLLYILENTNSIKGKGLEGKFVYGWDGKDLVLIPESAPEYKEMVNFTKLQDETVKKSQLIIGGIYIDSSNCKVTYMGDAYQKDWRNNISSAKKLWFATDDDYLTTKDIKSIKRYSGENNDKFATLIDKLEKDSNYYKGKPEYVKLELTEADLLKHFESVSRQYYAYTKVDGDLKKIEIEKPYRYYKGEYTVIIGREKEYFEKSTFDDSPLVNILKKYEIWQLKTTK